MISLLTLFTVISLGALGYSPVLEQVAHRRITYGWQLESVRGYDVLVAPADCRLLGRSGWLFVDNKVYRAIAVDCSQEEHKAQMAANGLLADVSLEELSHKGGWLVFEKVEDLP